MGQCCVKLTGDWKPRDLYGVWRLGGRCGTRPNAVEQLAAARQVQIVLRRPHYTIM
jgi:hypothetical protein